MQVNINNATHWFCFPTLRLSPAVRPSVIPAGATRVAQAPSGAVPPVPRWRSVKRGLTPKRGAGARVSERTYVLRLGPSSPNVNASFHLEALRSWAANGTGLTSAPLGGGLREAVSPSVHGKSRRLVSTVPGRRLSAHSRALSGVRLSCR